MGGRVDGGVDAASAPTDGGEDAAPELLDQVGEFLTCKPREIEPVLDCVTVTCAMESDPLVLLGCLTNECAMLVEKVNPKCGNCVLAGIAEDVEGLLSNCVDTAPIFGDSGIML